jgi:Raf kinase inhibitor-like YbhB/YbcL family protein
MKWFATMNAFATNIIRITGVVLLSGLIAGCSPATKDSPAQSETVEAAMNTKLTSTAFHEGETIPKQHTGDGRDVSPALHWDEPPAGTRSLALICDDPDAPRGTWVHWVIYDLPTGTRDLPEAIPPDEALKNGARQGKNDFGTIGYRGPSPPPGKPHRYFFKLYALDKSLNSPAGATKAEVEKAMKGHVLGETRLMGTYGREKK